MTWTANCVLRRTIAFSWALAAFAVSAPAGQTQAPPRTTVRVVTNEVIVPVTVADPAGDFVLDLSQDDFHVFDDGIEQSIEHWDLGGDPLAIALVIETSSRPHALIPEIRSLGSIFTETVMALDGEAAVLTYNSKVDVREFFTDDHDAVERAIKSVDAEDSHMHLYDAMARAVEMLKAQDMRRRIMLIVGESRDDGSEANFGAIVRDAQFANISIYAVGPSSAARDFLEDAPDLWAAPAIFLLQQGINRRKGHDLEVAAIATGGIHYTTTRAAALRDATDRIGGELHAQYIIGYQPNSERAPGFHSIAVKVSRANVVVRTRPGYYVAQLAK
jgi:VWFA-related protein